MTLLCAALMLLHGSAHAQSSSGRFLTTAREVLRLSPPGAGASVSAVKLRGVVINHDEASNTFHVHDGTGTLPVIVPRGTAMQLPRRGQSVEVDGTTSSYRVAGYLHVRLDASRIVSGAGTTLPKGEPITLASLNTFSQFDQWVSVEGIIMEWSYHAPFFYVKLVSHDAWSTVVVRAPEVKQLPKRVHGARLRATGIAGGSRSPANALTVPALSHLEFLSEGSAQVFDVPLVSIPDVMSRKLEPAKRVRVQGTVLATFQKLKVILHGDGGVMTGQLLQPEPRYPNVEIPRGDAGPLPELKPGDRIDLEGSIFGSNFEDLRANGLSFCHVRVIGQGEVIKPESVEIETMLGYRNEDHWLSIEGTCEAWTLQNNVMLFAIAGPRATTTVSVRDWPPNFFPTKFHGARLRFTGVSCSLGRTGRGCDFVVPGHTNLDIRQPGSDDPFQAPEKSTAVIASKSVPAGERVRTKGMLVGRSSDAQTLYLRGADAALSVHLKRPWYRQPTTAGMFYADFGPWPELKPGDELEVVGTPIHSDLPEYAPFDLTGAGVRVLRHQSEPVAADTALPELIAGARTADLVKTHGRLITVHQVPQQGGGWRTTMILEAGGKTLPAIYQGSDPFPSDLLKIDDELLVQGVVIRAIGNEPRQLIMRSAGDVKSLGLSPVVRARQLWMWGGSALAVFSLFASWIVALRKSNRNKTEIAAMLEQRVNERTAELRQAQADLNKALDQERELSELKSRFVSMVSHEFRTPLGVTMSAVEIIRHFDAKLTSERRLALCDDIHTATRNMADLMEQVLLLGRVEAGKLGYKPAAMDVETLLTKIVDEQLSATHRKCPIVVSIPPQLEEAQADEALLRHIFGNLISNAVKYSPAGSDVIFRARCDGHDIVCEIQDRGIGIPEKDRAHLFEAFHRAGNVGDIPGTGLGLVIVKRCVDLHGGSIDLRSEVGQGTTFIVRLPVFGG